MIGSFGFGDERILVRMVRIYLIILMADVLLTMVRLSAGRIITKPLLMPILIWGLVRLKDKISSRYFYLWTGALVFSWFGDLFLMGAESFFIPGLVSFLVAHLFYIGVFAQWNSAHPPAYKWMGVSLLVTAMFFIWFYRVILASADYLFFPVLVYAVVILLMWFLAVYRSFRIDMTRYWIVVGAGLFVVSDAILGYGKFSAPSARVGGWIMLTYGLAQLFLFMGIYQKSIENNGESAFILDRKEKGK